MSKHLGVRYEWNADGSLTIHQQDYITDIIDTYEEKYGESRSFPTPGYPGKCLLKHEGDPIEVTGYRSFVGKLLFAMKKTYPELANPVRELSSHMECPGEEHWKSIGRMVGYLKHEATLGCASTSPRTWRSSVWLTVICNEQGYSEEYYWLLSYCGWLSCELDVESTAKCYTEQY